MQRLDSGILDATPPDVGIVDAGFSDGPALDAQTFPDATVPTDAANLDATAAACALPEPPLTAGSIDCAGCPSTVTPPASYSLALGNVTTLELEGTVTSAAGDGMYAVIGQSGRRLDGVLSIGASGDWAVTVPLFCGAQQVVLSFCNASGTHSIVYDVTTTCTEPDLRITIAWDELGDDWELHLIREGGHINEAANDCTWTTCLSGGLDWGVAGDPVDDPLKDVDDVDGYGPENITLQSPAAGAYTLMVEHWGTGTPGSDGTATLNVLGRPPIVVPIVDLSPRWVRTVATVTFPGGAVVQSTQVHDCTMNWSGGCRDLIP